MIRTMTLAWCAATLLSLGWANAEPTGDASADTLKLIEVVKPSLVRVEFTLQYDKGQAPDAAGWRYRCPSCGEFHARSGADTVEEERPFELPGYVIGPDRVLIGDPQMHGRFIKSIAVRDGDQAVGAKIVQTGRDHAAVILQTERPLTQGKPLQFDTTAKPPYFAVSYDKSNARWLTHAAPLSMDMVVSDDGEQYTTAPTDTVIVDATGKALTVAFGEQMPAGDGWKTNPTDWTWYSADQLEAINDRIAQRAAVMLPRVALSFRSPRKRVNEEDYYDAWAGEGGESLEQDVVGLVLGPKRVLVLQSLDPQQTARLRRVRVFDAEGNVHEAKFAGSFERYGALIVDLDEPMPGEPTISDAPLTRYREQAVFGVAIRQQGEVRTAYTRHRRIPGFSEGWRGQVNPDIGNWDDNEQLHLFNEEGTLIALSIAHRNKTEQDRWSRNRPEVLDSRYVVALFDELDKHLDRSNIPLTEREEARVAWIGVETQPLTQELARMNNVAEQTADGETGVMVTYVYPDSPAAKAGIEAGAILLRLHPADVARPIEIEPAYDQWDGQPFPWAQYGEIPEQYFDRIPVPWSPAESTFRRALTTIGLGKSFTLEYVVDGQVKRWETKVVQSPDHYDMAAQSKSEALGMTVRDLTFEVRRYFKLADDAPGAIISKIEMGSKASIAGLKPYEIVTEANGKPVKDAATFAELTKAGGELRLKVTRMDKNRLVKINIADAGAEEGGDGDADAADDADPVEGEVEVEVEVMGE